MEYAYNNYSQEKYLQSLDYPSVYDVNNLIVWGGFCLTLNARVSDVILFSIIKA